MKFLKQLPIYIAIIAALLLIDKDERAARRLAGRIVPEYVDCIDFRKIDDTLDVFELSSERGKLIISGNNANSMAMGLNHYL